MCIEFDGHHFSSSSFVYVNDFLIFFIISALRKKKTTSKESQYLVSHPKLGLDPPIGLDLESGCDIGRVDVRVGIMNSLECVCLLLHEHLGIE